MTQTHAERIMNSETHLPTEPQSPTPAPPEVRLSKRLYSARSPFRTLTSPKRSPVPKQREQEQKEHAEVKPAHQ